MEPQATALPLVSPFEHEAHRARVDAVLGLQDAGGEPLDGVVVGRAWLDGTLAL